MYPVYLYLATRCETMKIGALEICRALKACDSNCVLLQFMYFCSARFNTFVHGPPAPGILIAYHIPVSPYRQFGCGAHEIRLSAFSHGNWMPF